MGSLNATGGFQENNGLFGKGHARFLGVVSIVQTNGNEFANMAHGTSQTWFAFDQGQFGCFELAQFSQHLVAQLLRTQVLNDSAQISQLAILINETGFFFTRVAITNEFHTDLSFKKIHATP